MVSRPVSEALQTDTRTLGILLALVPHGEHSSGADDAARSADAGQGRDARYRSANDRRGTHDPLEAIAPGEDAEVPQQEVHEPGAEPVRDEEGVGASLAEPDREQMVLARLDGRLELGEQRLVVGLRRL